MSVISIIVAAGLNNGIGRDNDLLCHLPADKSYFKEKTLNKPVIMGRKTYKSIPKKFRPLPKRQNIVLTRQDLEINGCDVAHSFREALEYAGDVEEIMIAGGEQIYRLFLPYTDVVYKTVIHETFDADTFFPELFDKDWDRVSDEYHEPDDKNKYPYSFQIYCRKSVA